MWIILPREINKVIFEWETTLNKWTDREVTEMDGGEEFRRGVE